LSFFIGEERVNGPLLHFGGDRAFHCLHNALRRCSNALKGAAAQPCGSRKTQPGSARPAALIFRAANAIRESQNQIKRKKGNYELRNCEL